MEKRNKSFSSWQSSVVCCKSWKPSKDNDSLEENPVARVIKVEAKPAAVDYSLKNPGVKRGDKPSEGERTTEGKEATVSENPWTVGGPKPDPHPVSRPPSRPLLSVMAGGNNYVALFDYSPRTLEDLGFNVGDTLEVLDKSLGDWWVARAVTGRSASCQGYIPANYVAPVNSIDAEPWYFPNTKRHDAERMLLAEGNKPGSFLIRSSEKLKGDLALSVLDQERVRHYKVHKLVNGHYYVSTFMSFPTMKELVEHYSKQADGLCRLLGEPCKKVEVPLPNSLSYFIEIKWEIDRESVKLQNKLGAGQFGEVYEGLWNGTTSVAVKTLKPDKMDPADFLREAEIMMKLHHPKLIKLYGICTEGEPIYIITELMKNGSLLKHLHEDKGTTLKLLDQIEMAAQVAAGMAYLESQNYIHRDLAARNVLVGENNICKVADFGLARVLKQEDENVYEAKEGTKFPVKWTAPEVIHDNKFTIKSDVWSFGILLYEIMTFGQKPYPGMSNMQAVHWIAGNNRMPCPSKCPQELHDIMMTCWEEYPEQRPAFETLQWQLEAFFFWDNDEDITNY